MIERTRLGIWLALLSLGALASCGRQVTVESGPADAGDATGASEAALVAGLEALATRQEVYRAENGRYAMDLGSLAHEPPAGIIMDVLQATGSGFSALATTGGGELECAYFTGDVRAPRRYVAGPGQVFCRV